jgi:hypothetical protein
VHLRQVEKGRLSVGWRGQGEHHRPERQTAGLGAVRADGHVPGAIAAAVRLIVAERGSRLRNRLHARFKTLHYRMYGSK